MTIIEAINRIDSLVHNTYSQTDKIAWLSSMDWMVKKHIIDRHEGAENIVFAGYNENTDLTGELLVPTPFDEMYMHWMEAQIHLYSGEYGKYNNSIIMYNNAFEAYAAYYTRNNMPISQGRRFLF